MKSQQGDDLDVASEPYASLLANIFFYALKQAN